MSGSTSVSSNETARKRQKTTLWSEELVKSAAGLDDSMAGAPTAEFFTKPYLLQVALDCIQRDDVLDLSIVESWVDRELEQLRTRVAGTTLDDDATEWAKMFLIPALEAFKRAIFAFNLLPPSREAIHLARLDLPPSEFVKEWQKHQRQADAHLCLRPPELKGLPLELLHPAFADFRQTLADPYPPPNIDDTVLQATHAATELCAVMGDHYDDDSARGVAFIEALDPLFKRNKWLAEYRVRDDSSSKRYANLDGAYYDNSKIRILRGDKDAPTGEAYIQLVHGYRWAVSRAGNKEPSHQENGAPMLLFLVKGTDFLVVGATFNGNAVVAEPLSPCIPMLEDWARRFNNRRTMLAHHLYAARRAYDNLMSASFDVPYKPVVPHPGIYPTRIEWKGLTGDFEFNSPHEYLTSRTLLFAGTIKWSSAQTGTEISTENETPPNPTRVVIKLVYGPYGRDLHEHLASKNFAPKLYGMVEGSHHKVVPRAIVMEDLHGPTQTEAGWVPLYTFLKGGYLPVDTQKKMFEVIAEIARTITTQGLVHGDLRSPNLMIRIGNKFSHDLALDSGGRAQLRVIDFDWAGLADTVRYPLQRTESEIWPGENGGPISAGDDWRLIKSWWSTKYPQFDLSPYDVASVLPDLGTGN